MSEFSRESWAYPFDIHYGDPQYETDSSGSGTLNIRIPTQYPRKLLAAPGVSRGHICTMDPALENWPMDQIYGNMFEALERSAVVL